MNYIRNILIGTLMYLRNRNCLRPINASFSSFHCTGIAPPLLKKWLDDVLTRGWAYGSLGNALHGKKFGIAISIGNKKENYSHNGSITFTVDEIIAPFKATTIYIGATALPHFSFFGASFQVTDEEIEQSAKDYMDYIRKYNFLSMIESKPEIFRKL